MMTIKFSKEIYPAEIIRETAAAFGHLAEIRITEDAHCCTVSFDKCTYDELLTAREFGNYAIDLMNNTGNGKN